MTRGERNNNPLNIRRTKSKWLGLKEEVKDKAFCEFRTLPYGFRAAFKLFQSYYLKHKCITLRQVISRWAPESENNTKAYIDTVAKYTGINPDDMLPSPMKSKDTWVSIAIAMGRVECNKVFPRAMAEAGYDMSVLR